MKRILSNVLPNNTRLPFAPPGFTILAVFLFGAALITHTALALDDSLVNVALSENGGKATSDSVGSYLDYKGTPDRAINGDLTEGWRGTSIPGWLQVEFKEPYAISKVGIAMGSHQQSYAISLSLDGTVWTTVVGRRQSSNDEGEDGRLEVFTIQAIRAKYLRVDITRTSAPGGHIFQSSINEVQAFGQAASADVNVALSENGGKATSDSVGSYLDYKGTPDRAINGDLTEGWRGTSIPGWLQVEFKEPYAISKVGIAMGSHQQSYAISLSLDGTEWTTVVNRRLSSNDEGEDGRLEVFTIQAIRAKYLRVDITRTSAPGGHIFQSSINEVQAFGRPVRRR